MHSLNFRAQSAIGQVTGPAVAVSRVIASGAHALGEGLPALLLVQFPVGLSMVLWEHLHYRVAREVFTDAELKRIPGYIRSDRLRTEDSAALIGLVENLIMVYGWKEREEVAMLPIELREDTLVRNLLPQLCRGRHWSPFDGLHGFLAYLVRHPRPRLTGTRVVTFIGTEEEPAMVTCAFDRAGGHMIHMRMAIETGDLLLRAGDVVLVRERASSRSN